MDSKKKILLVEDNYAHAQLISRALEGSDSNYTVQICANLQDARNAIQSATPDILISDLNLPDGKGLELIAPPDDNHQYPMILMTSYGDETIAVGAMKAGAFDYIVKSPETFEAMSRSVERVLREWDHIVDKKHVQQALLQKEQDQSEILNSMVAAVITIDKYGNILTFNKSAETLFGYSGEEIIGQKVNRLMPEPFSSEHDSYLQNYFTTRVPHVIGMSRSVDGLRKNGNTVPINISVAELSKDTHGRQRYIASCQDLTYSNQQEEQLRRSQKMDALGKLTGGVAHDYNNTLGIILGYAELLEMSLVDNPKQHKYVKTIMHAANRGAELTKKLLSFARKDSSKTTLLNINTVLQDQRLMLEKTLTARIQLIFDFEKNLWLTELDSGDLEDVIINLSINAMHAMDDGGKLTVQTQNIELGERDADFLKLTAGKYILLNIIDTGCGMDYETREKIFDPFYSTKGDGGTGLGLSQVYGFVERSKGGIKVYSEPEQGTHFSIYLPVSLQQLADVNSTAAIDEHYLQGSETILVVDDEPAMVSLADEILTAQGYHVLTANDGVEAKVILDKSSVDLLITDVIMPNMDGYQLSAYVQENFPGIKIQIVSGFADARHQDIVDEKLRHNMLNKPYVSQVLLTHVRKLLDDEVA